MPLNPQEEYYRKIKTTRKGVVFFLMQVVIASLLWNSLYTQETFYEHNKLLERVAYTLITFLYGNVLILVLRTIIISLYLKRPSFNEKTRGSFVIGIGRIASVLQALVIALSLMFFFQINPKEFITSITIVAMAIALIFKEYITNMLSGFFIMFSDQLTLGDYIKIADNQGKVIDITLSNIVVLNDDDDTVMIPNNLVFVTSITNRSLQNSRMLTLEFELPLNFTAQHALLEQKIADRLAKEADYVIKNSLKFKIMAISKDSAKYKVQFLMTSLNSEYRQAMRAKVYAEIAAYTQDTPLPSN